MNKKMRRIPVLLILIIMISLMITCQVASAPTRTPSQPRNLTGVPRAAAVLLAWEEPSVGASTIVQYNIWRAAEGEDIERIIVGPDTLSFTDRGLENGKEYNYYVTAENAIGEGPASNFVQVTPDGDPPAVIITSPSDDSAYPPGPLHVTWVGADPTSKIDSYHIRIDDEPWTDLGLADEKWITNLDRGSHVISVQAIDAALNRGYDSINITIDDRAPVVVIRTPGDHEFVKHKDLTITWDAYETESEIAGYEVFVNGKYSGYRGEGNNYTIDNIKDGHYWIEVVAYDIVGNTGSHSINITVDTSEPNLVINDPNADVVMNGTMINFSWEGVDPSGIAGYQIFTDTMGWYGVGDTTDTIIGPLPEGMNRIKIKATDHAGWESVRERVIMVDRTGPIIEIGFPKEGETYSSGNMTIAWNHTDDLSGVDEVYIRVNENEWVKDFDNERVIWTWESGIYVISVKVIDRAGNIAIKTIMFEVDNDAPLVTGYGPTGSEILPPDKIWFGTNEEMDDIYINVSGLMGRLRSTDEGYTWTPDQRFEFGRTYMVVLSGKDGSGNELEYFAWTFTITDQVMILGAIFDEDGDPLEDAQVLMDTGRSIYSDEDGRFNMTVTMGNRTILIKKSGYETVELNLELTPDRTGYIGNVYLEKSQRTIGKKVSKTFTDPWTYIVLSLVLIILGLAFFLFKDQISTTINRIKPSKPIEVKTRKN